MVDGADPELDPLEELLRRFDADYLGRRMRLQVDHVVRAFSKGESRGRLHLEEIGSLFPLIELGLRLLGLGRVVVENVMSQRVSHNLFHLPGLPPAFSGLKILHLSDLHIDLNEKGLRDLGRAFAGLVMDLDFDLCVITGDFRYRTSGSYEEMAEQMAELAPSLRCRHGVYGILGNHDFVEEVPYLERMGIQMLVNESAVIEEQGEQLWLVGLDDPHFYGTHDLDRAMAGVPDAGFRIALIHSPELAREAAARGVALYLTGHTHGGQLCLPGGIPVITNASCGRDMISGSWSRGAMLGYTSNGTGSSGLPGRLNCPPEVALHELRRA